MGHGGTPFLSSWVHKIGGERSQALHSRILGGTIVGTRITAVYLPLQLT